MLKLDRLYGLGFVRQRFGADTGTDTSFDKDIEELTPEEYVKEYCGWRLGDGEWGSIIIEIYESAKRNEVKP